MTNTPDEKSRQERLRYDRWRQSQVPPERPYRRVWTQADNDDLARRTVERNPPPDTFPGWADPTMLFQCECGKVHLRESGIRCESCGRDFPDEYRRHVYR